MDGAEGVVAIFERLGARSVVAAGAIAMAWCS
jgi:hypothetical protein